MTDKKNNINQDFLKGIGVGILIVLSIAFIWQNVSGGDLSFGGSDAKVLKKTSGTNTNTAPTQQPPAAGQPEPTQLAIADVTSDDHIYGEQDAAVTIVEYSDLECPFCASFHPTVKSVVDSSDGNVNWVYRHFPLSSIHPDAQKLAEASECVADNAGNEAFWDFLDYVFANATSVSGIQAAADAVGADGAAVQTCVDDGTFADRVKAQYDDAVNNGGRGTPYSIVVGPEGDMIPLSGAVPQSQIQSAIDSLL